jgi:hypothetical protein
MPPSTTLLGENFADELVVRDLCVETRKYTKQCLALPFIQHHLAVPLEWAKTRFSF